MAIQKIADITKKAHEQNKRIVAPLVGFPGCNLTGFSIKVAQQNHSVHYACINELVKLLKPDIAFMMMDLSVEANALGLFVRFPTDESSSVEMHPVDKIEKLEKYKRVNILHDSKVQSYVKTIEMMRIGLPDNIPVCAYVIGPLSLAGLLRSAENVAMDTILDPDFVHAICRFTTGVIQRYTRALINAGADLICILEPTAVVFGPEQFRDFSGYYVHHIIESYKYANVETIYHVCGNTMHLLDEMAKTGVAALSIDSPETGNDIHKAARQVPEDIAIIGNISPTLVMVDGSPEQVKQETTELLETMRPYPNFILSTGCDIPQEAPTENMVAFMEAARNFK